jgi:hypothetical protein
MKLFQIDSTAVQDALFDIMEVDLDGFQAYFRIDGLKEKDGKWYYYSYGRKPAFSELDWLIDMNTFDGMDSLVATNMAYPSSKVIQKFKVDGLYSNLEFNLICEFK